MSPTLSPASREGDGATPRGAADATPLGDGYLRRLVIRSIGRIQFVDVAQIDWLEGSGNYVEIHAGKERTLHRERLHVLEAQLDPAQTDSFTGSVRNGAVRRDGYRHGSQLLPAAMPVRAF